VKIIKSSWVFSAPCPNVQWRTGEVEGGLGEDPHMLRITGPGVQPIVTQLHVVRIGDLWVRWYLLKQGFSTWD
jgi:hypothetical protein